MNKNGPIIIIEDDKDDMLLLKEIFAELNFTNEIVYFTNGTAVLEYLNRPDVFPFIILSDVNMPVIDGFRLREKVFQDGQISIKCIPYLFFTTAANKKAVVDAYSLSVQGFFVKPNSFAEIKETIGIIVKYWQKCFSPNNFP